MRKYFAAWCLLFLCLLVSPVAEAKGAQLHAIWLPQIYTMGDKDGEHLLAYGNNRDVLSEALTKKMQQLQSEGKLPFFLEFSKDIRMDNLRGNINMDIPIGVMPLVTLDQSMDTAYRAGDEWFYRSIVMSALSLAICSAGDEQSSLRILGVVPMDGSSIVDEGVVHHEPFSKAAKADCYQRLTLKMFDGIDFKGVARSLRDWQDKQVWPDTYQIVDVAISSEKARQVYHGKGRIIRNIVGNFYTTEYAKRTQRIVLPPVLAGDMQQKMNEQLYSFEVSSPTNTMRMEMEKPKYPITLDISGLASGEVARARESAVRRDVIYKVWLTKTPVEGKEQGKLDDYITQPYLKSRDSESQVDESDLYTEVLIGLAKKMANQKR